LRQAVEGRSPGTQFALPETIAVGSPEFMVEVLRASTINSGEPEKLESLFGSVVLSFDVGVYLLKDLDFLGVGEGVVVFSWRGEIS
jgi:hypothetical protein